MMKPILATGAVALVLLGAVSAPSMAQAQPVISVQFGAPPPPRSERIPSPRRGHVWSPGHYEIRRGHYVWTRGYWVRERPGYVYSQPSWRDDNGRWAYSGGRWERGARGPGADRDRDGVPNRFDRDRDGDGVPNRFDRRPNNPRRQ